MNEHGTHSEQEIALALVKVPLLRNLTSQQLKTLAQVVVEREFPAGAKIVEQGAEGTGLFIIASGHANAVIQQPDGSLVTVNSFGPTDFFGEMALLDEGPRTATVITSEPTRCLVIASWDFFRLMKADSEMAVNILVEMSHRFRMALKAE